MRAAELLSDEALSVPQALSLFLAHNELPLEGVIPASAAASPFAPFVSLSLLAGCALSSSTVDVCLCANDAVLLLSGAGGGWHWLGIAVDE